MKKREKKITPLLHHPLPQLPLGLIWAASWQGSVAVATAERIIWRKCTCVVHRDWEFAHSSKTCLWMEWLAEVLSHEDMKMAVVFPSQGLCIHSWMEGDWRVQKISRKKGSEVGSQYISPSFCTEAPSDFSLNLSMHTAKTQRRAKAKVGLHLDTSLRLPFGGAWERRQESRGVCTCTLQQCATSACFFSLRAGDNKKSCSNWCWTGLSGLGEVCQRVVWCGLDRDTTSWRNCRKKYPFWGRTKSRLSSGSGCLALQY